VVRLVSWNIGGPGAGWPDVTALDADVALLQEAPTPPVELRGRVFRGADDGEWLTTGPEVRRWRTAIVRLTERVALEPVASGPLGTAWGALGSSRTGSWSAARLHLDDAPPVTVASVYAAWERSIEIDDPHFAVGPSYFLRKELTAPHRQPRAIAAGFEAGLPMGWTHASDLHLSRHEALGLRAPLPRIPRRRWRSRRRRCRPAAPMTTSAT
jgi:hypothetical protein